MVLVDSEGGRIQASIRKPMMRKFGNVIVEGEVYKMIYFSVVKNVSNFRATKHEFKLIFNSRTRVFRAESLLIPEYGLSLSSSEDIRNTKVESEFLYDMMGLLTVVSAEKNIVKDGKTTRLIMLELTDDKGKIRCTLFGDFVDKVNEFLSMSGNQLTIVIIQFARVNTYKGDVGLVNIFNTSRLLWNPQIVEAIDFRKSVACHEVDSDISIGFLDDEFPSLTMKEEFLNSFPRKNLEELQTCEEDGFFIVLGTIVSIIDEQWWYLACSCNRSVSTDDEDKYYCTNCATYVCEVTPRQDCVKKICDDLEIIEAFKTDASIVTPQKLKFFPKFGDLSSPKLSSEKSKVLEEEFPILTQPDFSNFEKGDSSSFAGKDADDSSKSFLEGMTFSDNPFVPDSVQDMGNLPDSEVSTISMTETSEVAVNDYPDGKKEVDNPSILNAVQKRKLRLKNVKIEKD
ncbi:Nucleic acid-binding, OB-fold [Sesbania bispinosa]|nr:Nucleic acid-binding, OB-fold [Sesbania bispinosa]